MDPLRPRDLSEFVGNAPIVEDVKVAVEAARKRMEEGSPYAGEISAVCTGGVGLGKSTLGIVVARELGHDHFTVSGGSLQSASEVRNWLWRLCSDRDYRGVMIVDEADAMCPQAAQEFLHPLEGCFRSDDGEVMDLRDTVFWFTSNTLSKVLPALISRCALRLHFVHYTDEECSQIASFGAARLGYRLDRDAADLIGSYSQGEARAALSLLRTLVTHLVARDGETKQITRAAAESILRRRLHPKGVNEVQRKILAFLAGRPRGTAGLRTLSAAVGEDVRDVERYWERALIRFGYLTVEANGRSITGKGRAFLASLS